MADPDRHLSYHIKVGIYWSIDEDIIGDSVYLSESEEYGDALQYGGHYEFWEKLRPSNESERRFKSHAYDYYPRGRVVFFPKRQTVCLYFDRCMDNNALTKVTEVFGIQEYKIEMESDEHYRCAGCNRYYLE